MMPLFPSALRPPEHLLASVSCRSSSPHRMRILAGIACAVPRLACSTNGCPVLKASRTPGLAYCAATCNCVTCAHTVLTRRFPHQSTNYGVLLKLPSSSYWHRCQFAIVFARTTSSRSFSQRPTFERSQARGSALEYCRDRMVSTRDCRVHRGRCSTWDLKEKRLSCGIK